MALFSKKNKKEADQSSESADQGLEKTRDSVFKKLSRAVVGKTRVDDEVLDNLEEVLVSSDVGVNTTLRIIERIENRVKHDKYMGTGELNKILKEEIIGLLEDNKHQAGKNFFADELPGKPYVIMVLGVNGVGKTTTIAKLANQFKKAGKNVVLGAADTFRAAAIDQLEMWANKLDIRLIKQQMGSDPASVAYDSVQAAIAGDYDVVIIDTAGRLHNKNYLMQELSKIKKAIQKLSANVPQEILLVLDASTGQNAFEQAKQFTQTTDVNTLALTKLDGTAKGGVVIGVSDQFSIPVKYIGVGEKVDDIKIFDRKDFVESLFD